MRNEEYITKCFDIYKNGGTLWTIERTDTNEFYCLIPKMGVSSRPETWKDTYIWNKKISFVTILFLTKEDAEKELQENMFMRFTEGGCHCCGHGSTEIPIAITEHEFVQVEKN